MAHCCSDGVCSITSATPHGHKHEVERKSQKGPITRALVSFILLMAGIVMSTTGVPFFEKTWIRLGWYLIAYLPVGIPVLKEAWESILEKDIFNEFTLMSIATIGAFFIGEFPEGVAVMLFYSVGELFQDAAVNSAKRNIGALLDVRPEKASVVVANGIVETVLSEEVRVGDTVEVKVGERVPLDGIMLSGSAAFNTSVLTGESIPRNIKKDEEVLAGMIAVDGVCRIKVTRPFGESALTRILELVQDASERKAPAEHFIRKFARIYTPMVTLLAVLIILLPWFWSLVSPEFTYLFIDWLYRGLVFLVISCPCALVISIPLGYFGGIGTASRQGILFKGGNYLDVITKINTVVMDKTGTLTKGVFAVQDVIAAEGLSRDELLRTVAMVETQSNHPIAKAIVSSLSDKMVSSWPVNVREVAGEGMEAEIDGKKVLAGNIKLLQANGVTYPHEVEDIPETTVLCAIDGKYAGYIVVADAPKEDARVAIEKLHQEGIKNIVMLSGDKQTIVSKLAGELGIDHAYGDLLPEGKVEKLEELMKDGANRVAFVGDGINDAPALALSDVGIAMGGLGSDVAIETADVIIQTDQPGKIPMAVRIGKETRQIILQNITMAIGVKLAVLLFGAMGMASLWAAVFADVGVSLLAILNAIRIMRKKF